MPRAGQRVGRYELIRLLGQGGMGQVWLARGEVIAGAKRSVALKFFPYDSEGGELDTFMAEARVAMLLTHSNIVQVFDAGDSESGRFLVMEWVDGVDLGHIWKGERKQERSIELETVVYVLAQVLRALHYAHGLRQNGLPLQIVHRDVSPQNVMISVSGEVKLADFGIARSALHSTTGTHIKGKLRYMPPEQLEGLPLTGAADLYAVGAMFHELVSNAPFRRGRSVEEMCREITMAEIPDLEPGLPDELEAIRRRLLAKDPEERFASAEEALRAMQDWASFRDRTFDVAELCQRYAVRDADGEHDEAERAATQPVAPRQDTPAPRVSTEPARIDPLVREPSRSRWPLAVVVTGVLLSATAVLALWKPWMQPTEMTVAAAATPEVPPPEPAPRTVAPEPTPAPEPEPEVAAAPPDVPAEEVRDPAATRTGSTKRKRGRTPAPATTDARPDSKVLASVRSAARSACRARDGQAEVRIDFLIDADGRPALLRSSAPGDARSKCIEEKLRGARFTPGSGRRASLSVAFDP